MFRTRRRTRNAHLTLAAAVATCGLFGCYGDHFKTEGGNGAAPASADPLVTLREEFSRLQTEALDVVDVATAANRELSEDEKAANETRFSRMKMIQSTIDERAKFAGMALNGHVDAQSLPVQRQATPPGEQQFRASEAGKGIITDADKIDRQTFSRKLATWGLTGIMSLEFATITTATDSGILLPRAVMTPIAAVTVNTFREALNLYGMKPMESTTTENVNVPVLDISAGAAVAQNASSETENEPELSNSFTLNVAVYQSGSAWISNMQLAANSFDLVGYITQEMVYAKELGFEAAIAAAIIADAGITQTVATATTTGFTYANLVDLNNKLPKRYDQMKVILLSATAFAAAEKLIGDDGHPVLVTDPQNQRLKRFNGTPVLRCDYFEALAADNVVGCIFSLIGFKLRDAADQKLARYTQNSAKPDQTGFNLFGYHGYGYTTPAIATLKTPVS